MECLNINKEALPMEARPKLRYWLPAAAVDDSDLVREVEELAARGFGGIEVVPLLGTPEEIIDGEDGWGTEHWNHVLALLERTVRRLGMSLDVANGPMWPISMPTVKSADDPASLYELTYGTREFPVGEAVNETCALPERRVIHEEGTPKLLHICAWQEDPSATVHLGSFVDPGSPDYRRVEQIRRTLRLGTYIDLRGALTAGGENAAVRLSLHAPENGCRWIVFAFYGQPAAHKTANGHYYVVDHLSEAGAKACEDYWKPIFERYQNLPAMESLFCDSLEYRVSMDWTRDFPDAFERRCGYSILPWLPIIGSSCTFPVSDIPGFTLDDRAMAEQINHDYLETLTACYCERHLAPLEQMAERYGKTVRYQVAYNKPFEEERCGLYVGVPENEALGRPAMDGMKAMAAAAHLGRKVRYSFECAAEFGHSYGQSYEDLFWWVKRGLMAGMNAQVLHGGAYSGAYHGRYTYGGMMRGVQWPGYEAFGKIVSNYWNRTLSREDARGCLDAITRLNALFRKQAKVDCAVYRQSYSNNGLGSEFYFFPDNGALCNHGYTYETVSAKLLELPVCTVRNERLDSDGVGYRCLIIPEEECVPLSLLQSAEKFLRAGLPVIWVGRKPQRSLFYSEWREEAARTLWLETLDNVWQQEKLLHAVDCGDVVRVLEKHGIFPSVRLTGEMDLITAARVDSAERRRIYCFYAYNRVEFSPDEPNPEETVCSALFRRGTTKGTYRRPGYTSERTVTVRLEGEGSVSRLNYWDGSVERLDFKRENGCMTGNLRLEQDELAVLLLDETADSADGRGEAVREVRLDPRLTFDRLTLREFVPDTPEEKSFLRSGFSAETWQIDAPGLVPWRMLPAVPETFAGDGVYEGRFCAPKPEPGKRYILRLGQVCDTFRVSVNGQRTPFPDQVLKEADVTDNIREGENTLQIRVVSNLYNRLMKDTTQLYIPRDYGVWETPEHKCALLVRGGE